MTRMLALGACLAAGCVLLEERDLAIEPAGVLFAGVGGAVDAGGRAVFVFAVRSAGKEVDLEIDGKPVGRPHPTNARIELPADLLSPGPHTLTVRQRDVTPAGSVESTLAYYPSVPEVVEVSPPPAAGASPDSFTARLTFSAPLVPELVPDNAWLEAGGARLPARPRLTGGGRTVALELPAPVPSYGVVIARVSPRVFALPEGTTYDRLWAAQLLRARIVVPLAATVRGRVRVSVETVPGSTFPPRTELLADDEVIAAFDAPPPGGTWSVDWNTALVPDGPHALALRVSPGWYFAYETPPPTVTTDNIGPVLTGCVREPRPGLDCWRLALDSSGTVLGARLVPTGGPTLELSPGESGGWCLPWKHPDGPSVPDPVTYDGALTIVATAEDATHLTAMSSCAGTMPAWEADWGDPLPLEVGGPVSLGEDSFCGYVVVGDTVEKACPYGKFNALLAVGRAGADEGKVFLWNRNSSGGWERSAALNRTSGARAHGLAGPFWIERSGSGPGQVSGWGTTSRNVDPLQDADGVSWSPRIGTEYWDTFAWTEEVADGRVMVLSIGNAVVRNSAGSVVEAVAVQKPTTDPFAPQPGSIHAAWTERAPGGAAQLHVATITDWLALTPVPEFTNADPSASALEPAVFVTAGVVAVAWREGGRALARTLTSDGASGPVVLNADPGRRARLVRLDTTRTVRPVVYWVEENGPADEIRARHWDGSAWLLHRDAVNANAPGKVTAFTVNGQRIAWVDDAGRVHVRFANFTR